jgi:hypothetical protein
MFKISDIILVERTNYSKRLDIEFSNPWINKWVDREFGDYREMPLSYLRPMNMRAEKWELFNKKVAYHLAVSRMLSKVYLKRTEADSGTDETWRIE